MNWNIYNMSSRKTIVSILPHLKGGGVETSVCLLSEGLIKHKNCDVHIITIKEDFIPASLPEEVKVHFLDLSYRTKLNLRLSNRKKSKILEQYILENISEKPELILCHLETISKSMYFSKLENIYHVVHSNITQSKLKHRNWFLDKLITKEKLKKTYKNKQCICVSKGVKKDFDENYGSSISKLIYNAIDVEKLISQSEKFRPLQKGSYFIHVGNFSPAKRHDRLIEAYIKSKTTTPLILIGQESELTMPIKNLIKNEKLDNKITILGFESNPYPWIADAKGLILSSDFEGLGMVLLEALSLGTPIISTDCESGPSEIIGVDKQCLVKLDVDSLAKKIEELDGNPEEFKVTLRDEFRIEYMVERYYELALENEAKSWM